VKWLLDETLPPATAAHLAELGHDAISVHDVELAGSDDDDVFAFAVSAQRIVVTENFADYAEIVERRLSRDDPCVPVVFVRKSDFPPGGALPAHLAGHLDRWAIQHPEPYVGFHWP
jgi:predicted nuclease of predicted toxin-antitoxin system